MCRCSTPLWIRRLRWRFAAAMVKAKVVPTPFYKAKPKKTVPMLPSSRRLDVFPPEKWKPEILESESHGGAM